MIPRYFLVSSPGDDAHLENTTVKHGHTSGTNIASFDVVAALPGFSPVKADVRDAPYGGAPNDKIRLSVANQSAPAPMALADYAADLQRRNIDYTTVQGPYGLMQEDDAAVKTKVAMHHYFGGLYGKQLMITCNDAPGLSCGFVYPMDNATVTVSFAPAELPQWASLYPAAVRFLTGFRRN